MKPYVAKCRVDIFDWDIYFFTSREKGIRSLRKRKGRRMHTRSWKTGAGVCSHWPNEHLAYIGVFNKSAGTLAHECVHAAMHILERADIPAHWGNHEALTYITGYLVNQFTDAARKGGSK